MLAITWKDFENHGCPNCGCDSVAGGRYSGPGIGFGKCRYCGLNFEVREDENTVPCVKIAAYPKNPSSLKSDYAFEYSTLIPHPRKEIAKWHWMPRDIRPEEGEYFSSRGVGCDLSGFVRTKYAGERIHEIVKKILSTETPKSRLDYRQSEPEWIQYKFSPEEFDLEKIDQFTKDGIITEEILIKCKKQIK